MMIMVMNSKPFSTNMESISECLNEIVVILVSYCLMIFSDFVPAYNLQVKDFDGYFLIGIVTVVTCVYVYTIIASILMNLVDKIREKLEIREADKERLKHIEILERGLAICQEEIR